MGAGRAAGKLPRAPSRPGLDGGDAAAHTRFWVCPWAALPCCLASCPGRGLHGRSRLALLSREGGTRSWGCLSPPSSWLLVCLSWSLHGGCSRGQAGATEWCYPSRLRAAEGGPVSTHICTQMGSHAWPGDAWPEYRKAGQPRTRPRAPRQLSHSLKTLGNWRSWEYLGGVPGSTQEVSLSEAQDGSRTVLRHLCLFLLKRHTL